MRLITNCLLLIASVFLLNSCAPRGTIKKTDNWLPADFNPNKTTLLILATTDKAKGVEKWSKEIKKYYPYKYKVVAQNTKLGPGTRYSDSTKYQYILQCKYVTGNTAFIPGGGSRSTGYSRDWRFVDIHSQKEYAYTGNSTQGYMSTLVLIFNTIKKKNNYKK